MSPEARRPRQKKIQIIFSDLIIAACSPGAVTLLTSTGLHFGQNLCMMTS